MIADPQDLLRLADEVAACTEPTRELADRVLLACGWRLNHDAAEIAAWRTDPGTVEGEDGKDYPVTLEDRMTWACWYKPGNRPFRDSWIGGHYRPNPLASLDAAMTLIDGHGVLMHLSDIGADGLPLARVGVPGPDDAPIFTGIASCIMTNTAPVAGLALALSAAALKARAHSTKEPDHG